MLKLYISRGEENPVVEAIKITDWEIMSLIHRYFYYEARYPNMVKNMRKDAIAKGEKDGAEYKKQVKRRVLENRAKEKALEVNMPRYYVKNEESKWNVFSSVIDNYLFDDFMDFDELSMRMIGETVRERISELDSLLSDRPRLNVMSFEEAEGHIAMIHGERVDEDLDDELEQEE